MSIYRERKEEENRGATRVAQPRSRRGEGLDIEKGERQKGEEKSKKGR